jgi:hypothetical protein
MVLGGFRIGPRIGALGADAAIDRTDLRAWSRTSPCLGDVAADLTGGRIRFNPQDVRHLRRVWFILQRIFSGNTIRAGTG